MVEQGDLQPQTTPERPRIQQTAFMFDIDGVLTDPHSEIVNETLVEFIKSQLESERPVALITGRPYSWAQNQVINHITQGLKDKSKLEYLFVSAEHGGMTVTFEDGSIHEHVKEEMDVPREIKDKMSEMAKQTDGIEYDYEKKTMTTIKMEATSDPKKASDEKAELNRLNQEIVKLVAGHTGFKVLQSEIAVDVLNKAAGKRLSADEFLDFLTDKNVSVNEFIMFGDSQSDAEVTDELNSKGRKVKFAFVGLGKAPKKDYEVIKSSYGMFDKAAQEIITKRFKEYALPPTEFWGGAFSIFYLNPEGFEIEMKSSLTPEEALPIEVEKGVFDQIKEPDRLPKLGIRNITRNGSKISIDIKPISYPAYRDLAKRPADLAELIYGLELGALNGTAMVLFTTETDESSKIILQHRSIRNRIYGETPGASAAGIMDATRDPRDPARLYKVDTDSFSANLIKEMKEEIHVDSTELVDLRATGIVMDFTQIHSEVIFYGKTSLSAEEIRERSRKTPIDDHEDNIDFEEKFFVIDGTEENIRKLLTEVHCPLPPTHTAAFVAAGYTIVLEKKGQAAADNWKKEMEILIKENYEQIDAMVRDYYRSHPEREKKRYGDRKGQGYDPNITPHYVDNSKEERRGQGLPYIVDELKRVGLIEG